MKRRDTTQNFSLNDGTIIPFEPGQSILEALVESKIPVGNICGGMGSCGTCRVFFEEGLELIPERNEIETERAQDLNFVKNERQSCQIDAIKKIKIRIP